MARSEINTEFNTFVGGILTEANPINYPVGFTLDEENFILERNGTRRRRRGLKLDTTAFDISTRASVGNSIPNVDTAYYRKSFLWENPSKNNTGLNFSICSVFDVDDISDTTVDALGLTAMVHDLSDPTDVSGNYIADIDIGGIQTAVSVYKDNLLISVRDYSLILGTFPVAPVVYYLKYDGTTSVDLIDTLSIRCRNFAVAPDINTSVGINDASRLATLSINHFYNLVNQGWTQTELNTFYTATSTFPHIADNLSFAKNKGSAFTAPYLQNTLVGNKVAPTGKHVASAWGPSEGDAASLLERYTTYTSGDPTYLGATITTPSDLFEPLSFDNPSGAIVDTVTYGGRVFYLCDAISYPLLGTTFVAYSQVIGQDTSLADCYQQNDPTAEDLNQIVDTDGGTVDMSMVGKAIKIAVGRSRLLVFGTKGVYEILSQSDVFTPLSVGVREASNNTICNYSEYKTNNGSVSGDGVRLPVAESVVTFKDSFFYWSPNGVINLQYNKDLGEFVENNLTDPTIQTLYNAIPDNCKAAARGVFSRRDSVIMWCYSTDTNNPKKFTHALIFDLVLNAWTKFNFYTDDSCYILDVLEIPNSVENTSADDFLSQLLFIVETPDNGITTAYFSNDSFVDFQGSTNSGERQAFMQTGYLNANDSAREKQTTYIIPSFLRTEDGFTDDGSGNLTPTNESSCLISAWWDYVDDASLPKANDTFEAYKYNRLYIPSGPSDTFDYGQTVLTSKNRLTGRGRALSLRFETTAGKDCKLLGWSLGFGANAKV